LESARNKKQYKLEYLQLLAELDITNYYETIEFHHLAITNQPPLETTSRSTARKCLDDAAYQSILASERILSRNCKEWLDLNCMQ